MKEIPAQQTPAPRNPRGRPKKADSERLDPPFTMRLDRECAEFLDAISAATGLRRSMAIRAVLHAAIDELRAGRFRLFGPGRGGKRTEIMLKQEGPTP